MSSEEKKKPILNGTDLLHADDGVKQGLEVSPSISVTTIFRAPRPWSENDGLKDLDPWSPERHVYSRYTQDISTRVERVLSKINQGYAITYASGLASAYAGLVFLNPKRIAITAGYHGCHVAIQVYERTRGQKVPVIDIDDEYQPGDICWLETPLNPTGEARNIQYYADKIHAVGGKLLVDSTFAPPPLQYPFKWGADIISHSGTKYFGGHSDLLCGVLVAKTREQWQQLWHMRTYMGNVMGSLESWLLLRSLRTLHLRLPRQSETGTKLAQWLYKGSKGQATEGIPAGIIDIVWHSSLQGKDANGWEPSQQMEGGWNASFSMLMANVEYATQLPHKLKFFVPATSLGGVESLIEQRIASDPGADPRLVRISVGVEEFEDLKADLSRAFHEIAQIRPKL